MSKPSGMTTARRPVREAAVLIREPYPPANDRRRYSRSVRRLPQELGLAAPARDGDLARAGHLDQAERAHHALEGLDLLPRAGDLGDHRAAGDVDDLAAEDLHDLHDLAAVRSVGGDLEQRELAGHGLLR